MTTTSLSKIYNFASHTRRFLLATPVIASMFMLPCVTGCTSTDTGAPSGGSGGEGGMGTSSSSGDTGGNTIAATFRTLLKSTYLSATNGGGHALTAASATVGTHETFQITDLNGGELLDGDECSLLLRGDSLSLR